MPFISIFQISFIQFYSHVVVDYYYYCYCCLSSQNLVCYCVVLFCLIHKTFRVFFRFTVLNDICIWSGSGSGKDNIHIVIIMIKPKEKVIIKFSTFYYTLHIHIHQTNQKIAARKLFSKYIHSEFGNSYVFR